MLVSIISVNSSSSWVETSTTAGGDPLVEACSASATSKPLSPPRSMSTSATSGWVDAVSCSASARVEAVPTTVIPPASSIPRAEVRKAALSSTMRQRKRGGSILSSVSEIDGRVIPASRNIERAPLWERIAAVVLRPTSPPFKWGVITAAVLIAGEALVVHWLKQFSPENAFGAVFLFGVLVVSAGWGFWLALATSVASAAAYVWFHALEGSGSVAPAVAVFSVLALLTNLLVGQSRLWALESDQRRREADLSAALARTVLRAADPREALAAASARLSRVLELPAPGAILGEPDADCGPAQECILLRDDDRTVGSLMVPTDLSAADRRRVFRMVPNLEALLAAARDREVLYSRTVTMARQQAALRRVATLVANRVEPSEVFKAVTDELANELGVEHVSLVRFTSEGSCEILAARDDEADAGSDGLDVGERILLGGNNVSTMVFETGEIATLDYVGATGPIGATAICICSPTPTTVYCAPPNAPHRWRGDVSATTCSKHSANQAANPHRTLAGVDRRAHQPGNVRRSRNGE